MKTMYSVTIATECGYRSGLPRRQVETQPVNCLRRADPARVNSQMLSVDGHKESGRKHPTWGAAATGSMAAAVVIPRVAPQMELLLAEGGDRTRTPLKSIHCIVSMKQRQREKTQVISTPSAKRADDAVSLPAPTTARVESHRLHCKRRPRLHATPTRQRATPTSAAQRSPCGDFQRGLPPTSNTKNVANNIKEKRNCVHGWATELERGG